MGIADRARDALRPTNTIEAVPASPTPASPGYWLSSTSIHPSRHFDSAGDAAAAFNDAPVQDKPIVMNAARDGSARCVASTIRMDKKAGVANFEKSVGDMDKEFSAAYEAAKRAPRGPTEAGPVPERADQADKRPAYASEPESIAKAYYVEDKGSERHYFDDYKRSALAMRATDTSVSSKREDLNTIRAMLEIAQSRGWHSVDIRGSAEFKREAWIEATARGLEGRGFAPSDLDRQEADRRRAERGPSNEVRAQSTTAQAPKEPVSRVAAGDKAAPVVAVPEHARASSKGDPAAAALEPVSRVAAGDKAAPVVATSEHARASGKGDPAAAALEVEKKGPVKDGGEPGRSEPATPTVADHRKVVRDAQKELSQDGRLVLAALSEKIDRQMNRHNAEAKSELKAFVASELVRKERSEGPIVLSADQKRTAAALEPAQSAALEPKPTAVPRIEPEAPRRSLSR